MQRVAVQTFSRGVSNNTFKGRTLKLVIWQVKDAKILLFFQHHFNSSSWTVDGTTGYFCKALRVTDYTADQRFGTFFKGFLNRNSLTQVRDKKRQIGYYLFTYKVKLHEVERSIRYVLS